MTTKDFIRKLKNPKTKEYDILKQEVLGMNFTWTYKGSTDPSINLNTERKSFIPLS